MVMNPRKVRLLLGAAALLTAMGPVAPHAGRAGAPAGASASPTARERQPGDADAARVVTIYLVRHAEKAADDPRDPELSEAGRRRAARLVTVLQDEPLTHLFATPLKRAAGTLSPLAAARGLQVTTIMDVQEQAAALQALPPGAVAVLSGHANTVPQLVASLGGDISGTIATASGPQLPEDTYDRLFVAILEPAAGDAPARLLRLQQLRYGAP